MSDHQTLSPTAVRRQLHANGYPPVPLVGKAPRMPDWINRCAIASTRDVERWEAERADETNTGILCGTVIGIDIDVLDTALVVKIEALAAAHLGQTPLERTGRAPKCMLVYRTEQPLRKRTTSKVTLSDGSTAQVEILGKGQQFVAYGIHPDTNRPYEWTGRSPLDVHVRELPLINAEKIETFQAAVEGLLLSTPGATCNRRSRLGKAAKADDARWRDSRWRTLVNKVLKHVPNNDLDYDDWVEVGMALYDALGPRGKSLWIRFSAQSPKNVPETTERKWPSFAPTHWKTAGTLFYLARQNGWVGKVPLKYIPILRRRAQNAGRPEVMVIAGELPRCVDEAEKALIEADLGYYQRGGQIVRVVAPPNPLASDISHLASVRIKDVTPRELVEAFTRAARFRKPTKSGQEVDIDCPLGLAQTYAERSGKWNLPHLSGVIGAPTLRRDGTLLAKPGYDPATKLVYLPGDLEFPSFSNFPTREEGLHALSLFKKMLREFSFVSDADFAVALSAILSTVMRKSLLNVPMHVYSAPVAGSGKSLLVDIVSEIVWGRPAAVMSMGETREELEKRIGAALLAGDPIVAIDNCERPLGGDALCQLITQLTLKVRVLGKSLNVEVPTSVSLFATGNNLIVEGDLTRRTLVCRLDPNVERPELRQFDANPIDEIRQNRGLYVHAALTIVRAYQHAGCQSKPEPLGSFEDWSQLIRGSLLWLGEADPCETMETARTGDPKLISLTGLLELWNEHFGREIVTTAKVIEHATRRQLHRDIVSTNTMEFRYPELRESLLAVAGDKGAINGWKLGKYLSSKVDRIVGGYRLEAIGLSHGSQRWQLTSVNPQKPLCEIPHYTAIARGLNTLADLDAELLKADKGSIFRRAGG